MRSIGQSLERIWLAILVNGKTARFARTWKAMHACGPKAHANLHQFCGFRSRRLTSIPGIGPVTATALIAAIGNGSGFRRGRDLAAWVSMVPCEYSTGGKQNLLGISMDHTTGPLLPPEQRLRFLLQSLAARSFSSRILSSDDGSLPSQRAASHGETFGREMD